MTAWQRVLRSCDVPPATVAPAASQPGGDLDLAIWRTAAGVLVACDSRCPHQWSHLGIEGSVEGEELVCTAHGWRFAPDGRGWKRSMGGRDDPKSPLDLWHVHEADGWIEVRPR